MAHPKRKISKQRRDKRRTHHKLVERPIITDATTGETSLYHRVNPETGMYKGIKVMKGSKDE